MKLKLSAKQAAELNELLNHVDVKLSRKIQRKIQFRLALDRLTSYVNGKEIEQGLDLSKLTNLVYDLNKNILK